MEFLNTTPVAAEHSVITGLDPNSRAVMVTAKATFSVDQKGNVSLDRDDPFPVQVEDDETELGILPRDVVPKMDAGFEVMVVGQAHAPGGHPVPSMDVSLTVGEHRRVLRVTGDRVWQGDANGAHISAPEPFTTMPLDWSRAFGGSTKIEVDAGAFVDVGHGLNKEGRGFDHLTQAQAMKDLFDCPEGYPKFEPMRPLPNIEDPAQPLQNWADDPLPACWSPVPSSSGMVLVRLQRRGWDGTTAPDFKFGDPAPLERAHPDWVILPPEEGAAIDLVGMSPPTDAAGRFAFTLPSARILGEMAVADKLERFELHPRALVLLPEERRFYIVFRGGRRYAYVADEVRRLRLDLSRGWVPARVQEA